MKNRSLLLLTVGSMLLSFQGARAESDWIDLTLDTAQAGSPPPLEKFDKGAISHTVESLAVTENNKVLVIADTPNFPGKSLQFSKTAADPRTPWAVLVNNPNLTSAGKYRFTWEACVDSFNSSEKFPGFEALLTFVLCDRFGVPFFNLYYLVGRDESSGVFASGNKKFGQWFAGQKQKFEVELDLDAKTATIKIDGEQVGDPVPFKGDGLRVVQFTDGTGLANYGGKFTATVSHFKMTEL